MLPRLLGADRAGQCSQDGERVAHWGPGDARPGWGGVGGVGGFGRKDAIGFVVFSVLFLPKGTLFNYNLRLIFGGF